MTEIVEMLKYILNSQVRINRGILNHKGKSLVNLLINCVIKAYFFRGGGIFKEV